MSSPKTLIAFLIVGLKSELSAGSYLPTEPHDEVIGAGILQQSIVRVLDQEGGGQVLVVDSPGGIERGDVVQFEAGGQARAPIHFLVVIEIVQTQACPQLRTRGQPLFQADVASQLGRGDIVFDPQLWDEDVDAIRIRGNKKLKVGADAFDVESTLNGQPRLWTIEGLIAQGDLAFLRIVVEEPNPGRIVIHPYAEVIGGERQ